MRQIGASLRGFVPALLLLGSLPGRVLCQDAQILPNQTEATEASEATETAEATEAPAAASETIVLQPVTPTPSPGQLGFFGAIGKEVGRYGSDAFALVKAPLTWDSKQWEKAAGVVVIAGALFATDRTTYDAAQSVRSPSTDRLSGLVTDFGTTNAMALAGGILATGLIAKSPALRETGRDAVEATVLSYLVTNTILKNAAGRERPVTSNGDTRFDSYSGNVSFPSGHATQAFAVASVVSAHSKGWVVPTISYTLASLVAWSRVNDQKHFASDVFVGAVIGVGIGRFVVARHAPEEERLGRKVELDVVPAGPGLAARLRF